PDKTADSNRQSHRRIRWCYFDTRHLLQQKTLPPYVQGRKGHFRGTTLLPRPIARRGAQQLSRADPARLTGSSVWRLLGDLRQTAASGLPAHDPHSLAPGEFAYSSHSTSLGCNLGGSIAWSKLARQ